MERNNWVVDIETLLNCFILVAIHYKTDEEKIFVIHESRNDIKGLLEFLDTNIKNREWHITFNGLAFDSQVLDFIIKNRKDLLELTGEKAANKIYEKAQQLIVGNNEREFNFFNEKFLDIPQLDLFKVHHYDNPARRSSLKWLEYSMDFHNIQEMPIHHGTFIKATDIPMIAGYCKNDVLATKKLMQLSKAQVNMRLDITEKYGIRCYNFSLTKIGSELLLDLYCKKTGKKKWDVRKISTKRDTIKLKDVVFPYVKFESPEFNILLNKVNSAVVGTEKGDFKFSQEFRGSKFDYGKGGVHQCIHPGVYHSDDIWSIEDVDVAGLYPNLAVQNKMYPAHLGEEFYQVYKNDIVDVRMAEKAKKENRDMAIIEGFKEAANASYGNSNNKFSWLYDPFYTFQTTVNGQLLLSMLVEKLLMNLPDSILLQTNTDGITIVIKRANLEKYHNICKEWEKLTRLTLEFNQYKSMFIRDVNNYISLYTNGKTKCKGEYEWEELANCKPSHLHKNKSFLIVPKAVYNFFIHNISPEQSLADNKNIFDYCGGVKAKGEWEFFETCLVDGKIAENALQKVTRYYISKKGCKMIKRNKSDGRVIQIEAGKWLQTSYNTHDPNKAFDTYDINHEFYLDKIYKEIANIKATGAVQQLQLFE